MKKLITILIVISLFLTGCGQSGSSKEGKSQKETPRVVQDARQYNLEMYIQIKMGSSYDEIKAILGEPGEAMVDGDRLKQYMWKNEDESSINVTFYDQKVTAKSQSYLGPYLSGSNKVTLAKFDQVLEGMSLKEVSGILGQGTETLCAKTDDGEKLIYFWENDDGSSIGITLMDGKVTKKQKMMLK